MTNKNIIYSPPFVTLSCSLKIDVSASDYESFCSFADSYSLGLNYVSQQAFILLQNKQSISSGSLHRLCYSHLRHTLNLPSQVSCSISRDVSAKYKSVITRNKNKTTKKESKITKPFVFKKSTSISFQYKKDFSFSNGVISIKTNDGRIKRKFFGWNQHLTYIQKHRIGGGILFIERKTKKVFLKVTVSVPTDIKGHKEFVREECIGIDVGQRKIAVKVDTECKGLMITPKRVNRIRRRFQKVRDESQSKGTRSAKKLLRRIAGRERRFNKDVNHNVSKNLAKAGGIVTMENLKGIRKRIEPNTNKKHSKKKKAANKKMSGWDFSSMSFFSQYKTNLNGSVFVEIDPYMTSRTCPRCGHEEKGNRDKEEFRCLECGLEKDADIIGAMNILMRGWMVFMVKTWGQLSNVPEDGTESEKWRRLFKSLRWPESSMNESNEEVEA